MWDRRRISDELDHWWEVLQLDRLQALPTRVWPWLQDHEDSLGRRCWTYYGGTEDTFCHVTDMGHGMYLWEMGWCGPPPPGISAVCKRGTAWSVWGAQVRAVWAYKHWINDITRR